MIVRSRMAGALGVCVLLAVIHTWPLALHPGRLSRNDNGDTQLNEWILAWVAHQLPRDPRHLFEANIFYPAHDALAFSEPLIVPALMGAPLAWAGGTPVLVYNLVLIAGFALTALAGMLLVESWTGDRVAGLLTGSVLAFNTHTLTRLAHIQGIHLYALPLALLALDGLLRAPRVRNALLLALWLTLLAYTSGYLIVFAAVMLAVAVAARISDWWGRRAQAFLPMLGLSMMVSGIAIVPVWIPYHRVEQTQHMVRTLGIVAEYSATPSGYLASAGRIHFAAWSHRFFKDSGDSFFPGIVVLVLAAGAVGIAIRRARSGAAAAGDSHPSHALYLRRVVMLVAIALLGFVLSLGPATPLYRWLFDAFPPVQGLRAASRFGNLFILGVAALAGLGAAAWRDRRIAIVLLLVANLESLRAPITYREFTGIPGIYRMLATEPGPVVVAEQPFFPRWAIFENAPYVLASTAHWRPLMNGYSGYTPDSYQRYADAFWYFPDDGAIQAMKDAGVTHVVVHPPAFGADAGAVMERIHRRQDLQLLAVGRGGISLYRLQR